MQSSCVLVLCRLWLLWRHHIFPHHLTKDVILGTKFIEHKMCVFISVQLSPEIFLIWRIIQRDIVTNVKTSPCKVLVILVSYSNNKTARYCHKCKNVHWNYSLVLSYFNEAWIFWPIFGRKKKKLVKIRPVGAELFHADRQTDKQTKLVVAFRNFADSPKHQAS
jgi:hypothetical protein